MKQLTDDYDCNEDEVLRHWHELIGQYAELHPLEHDALKKIAVDNNLRDDTPLWFYDEPCAVTEELRPFDLGTISQSGVSIVSNDYGYDMYVEGRHALLVRRSGSSHVVEMGDGMSAKGIKALRNPYSIPHRATQD